MVRSKQASPQAQGLETATFRAILGALPFAVYGLDGDMTVLYNNGRHALRDFLIDDHSEAPAELIGSHLPDHIPVPEREPLRRLVEEVLHDPSGGTPSGPRGVDFLHASASGLQRLRVLATRVPNAPQGVDVLLTCHESAVNAPQMEQTPAGTARLDVARQLAATLNHEINNPLFIVSATLEDLLAEAEEPAEERRLRGALDAVWRVASAVKQLQDIRQVVTTAYIEGLPMVDLDASTEARPGSGERDGRGDE
jgi:signal transduction histidine kinase